MRITALILLLSILLSAGFSHAEENPQDQQTVTLEYEFDAYYSNVGIYASLTDTPIPHASDKAEIDIYRDLFLSSFIPRFLVLEASVNPLPCLGLFIRNNYKGFYDDTEVSEGANLVKAVTAGFEEPYAFALFLGDVISFTKPGQTSRVSNKGYMGYLICYGNYHIKDNVAISDNWVELEWKVKGDKKTSDQNLSWSFRGGAKIHTHPEISDVLYLSTRRSRTDYEGSVWSLLQNSGFEYTVSFDAKTFNMVENIFYVSKKWPATKLVTLSLDVGFIINSHKKYSGSLKTQEDDNDFTLLFRPNIEF
jgi:hypothetical protein